MIIRLSNIFFYINMKELENNINKILDIHNVDHSGFLLYSDQKSINISDDEGKHFMGIMLSISKKSFHPIDTINILTQFYIRRNTPKHGYHFEFIRDCCEAILLKLNIPLFKFEELSVEDDNPCVNFQLYKNKYKIVITNQNANYGINTLKLYMNIREKSTDEDNFLPIIKSKPLKIYGNPFIDILYQMILYTHYFVSYIKGNTTWDEV